MPFDASRVLRCVFERSPVPILVTEGPGHVVVAVNQAFEAAARVAEGSVVGRLFPELLDREAQGEVAPRLDEVLRAGRSEVTVVEGRLAGSCDRVWQLSLCPHVEGGAPAGVVVYALDCTAAAERDRLVQEAARRTAQLDAILEGTREGVVVVDAAGCFVLANRAAREALGGVAGPSTTEHLRGLEVRRTDGAPLPFERWPINRALRGERFEDEEVIYTRADGGRRWLVISGGPLELAGARLAMVMVRDVTALRRAEAERDEAMALISHDLRTPLQAITLRAELLHRELVAQGHRALAETAELIRRSTRRIAGMTDELSTVTSLEQGLALEVGPVDLLAVVHDAVEHAVPPERRPAVQIEAQGPLPPVAADAPRLGRAVANLAANAAKYSAPSSPIVVRLAPEGDLVHLTIEDHGAGIAPEELARVFDKSFRARAARRSTEGLGLGLYIVRLIVEAHGGRVWAESEVGRGSRFHVVLPTHP
jgi:PAS domain S-box-containing protein